MQKVAEEKAMRAQQARANASSGGDWTTDLLAMGAGAAIGAAIVGETDFLGSLGDPDTLSQIGRALTSNAVSGGGATGGSSAPASTLGASTNAGGSKTFSINELYRATCPDGRKVSNASPIQTNIPACAQAMRNLARAAGCNLYQEMGAAHAAYQSACATEMFK